MFLRLFVLAVLAVQAVTAQTQVDPKRNHRTRWWLSAIAALGAASVYTGANRQLEMPPPEMQPPNLGRGAGIIVTRQLGINFGITGAVLCGEWFVLRYQGSRHRKLEPLFMIVNYAGATSLSVTAAVELSGRKPAQMHP